MSKSFNYRKIYCQQKYNYGFDGYSYLGMEESTNQYAADLLHSFVLSEFHTFHSFPKEFYSFMVIYWKELTSIIRNIEQAIILELPKKCRYELLKFHNKHIGHCTSLNYYPSITNKHLDIRLSDHKDASLISVFPFGVREGLQIEIDGQWTSVKPTYKAIAFTGYLCQLLSKHVVKACNHRVIFSNKNSGPRFTSVFFSLPKRHTFIPIINCSSQNYFANYVNLF